MKIFKWFYEKIKKKPAPYYYNYSIFTLIMKPIRKWIVNCLAANCPFNKIRIILYKLCGFKIGKNVFIGMKCYLDDQCYKLIKIGNNVSISYGVYFACHGRNQSHLPIIIEDNAYIGMRASIISKNKNRESNGVVIGNGAIVGSCTLVNMDIPAGATAVGVPCKIIERN